MKNDNDKKIRDYKKKQIKKWLEIALYVVVVALEILALLNIIDMLWGCVLFILLYLFKKIL